MVQINRLGFSRGEHRPFFRTERHLLARQFDLADEETFRADGNSDLDRYLAILKSERALTAVIEKFDLVRVYDITQYQREKTMKELLSNTEFEESEEGSLEISVYDKDP